MEKRRNKEAMNRISPTYWTKEQVSMWVEETFGDRKLKRIFLEHEIDGPVLTRFLTYAMLRNEMNLVIGKATKVIEALVILMDKWEIPSARLLNEDLDINLAVGSRYRGQEEEEESVEEELERIRNNRVRRNVYRDDESILFKRPRNDVIVDVPIPNSRILESSDSEILHPMVSTSSHDQSTPSELYYDSSFKNNELRNSFKISNATNVDKNINPYNRPLPKPIENKFANDLFGSSDGSARSEGRDSPITLYELNELQSIATIKKPENQLKSDDSGLVISLSAADFNNDGASQNIHRLDSILGITQGFNLKPTTSHQRLEDVAIEKSSILKSLKENRRNSKVFKQLKFSGDLESVIPEPDLQWVDLVNSDPSGPLWFRRIRNKDTNFNVANFNAKSTHTYLWTRALMSKIDTIFANINIRPIKKKIQGNSSLVKSAGNQATSNTSDNSNIDADKLIIIKEYEVFWKEVVLPELVENRSALMQQIKGKHGRVAQDYEGYNSQVNDLLTNPGFSGIPENERLLLFSHYFTAKWLLKISNLENNTKSEKISITPQTRVEIKPQHISSFAEPLAIKEKSVIVNGGSRITEETEKPTTILQSIDTESDQSNSIKFASNKLHTQPVNIDTNTSMAEMSKVSETPKDENKLPLISVDARDLAQSDKVPGTAVNRVNHGPISKSQHNKLIEPSQGSKASISFGKSYLDIKPGALQSTNAASKAVGYKDDSLDVFFEGTKQGEDVTMSTDEGEAVDGKDLNYSSKNTDTNTDTFNVFSGPNNDHGMSQLVPPNSDFDVDMGLEVDEPDWDLEKVVDLNEEEILMIQQSNLQMLQSKRQHYLEMQQRKHVYEAQNIEEIKQDKLLIENISIYPPKPARMRRVFSCPRLFTQAPNNFIQDQQEQADETYEGRYMCNTDELIKLGVFSLTFESAYRRMHDYLRLQCYEYPPSQLSSNECFQLNKPQLYTTQEENVPFNKTGAVLLWQSFHSWLSGRPSETLSSIAFKPPGGFFDRLPVDSKSFSPAIRRSFWRFWHYHLNYITNSYNLISMNEKIPFSVDLFKVDYFVPPNKHAKGKSNHKGESKRSKSSSGKISFGMGSDDQIVISGSENEDHDDGDIFGFKAAGAFGEYKEFIDSDHEESSESVSDSDGGGMSGRTIARIIQELENESNGSQVKVRAIKEPRIKTSGNKSNTQPRAATPARKDNTNSRSTYEREATYMERHQNFLKEKDEEYQQKFLAQRQRESEIQKRILDQGLGVRSIDGHVQQRHLDGQQNMLGENTNELDFQASNLSLDPNYPTQTVPGISLVTSNTNTPGFNLDMKPVIPVRPNYQHGLNQHIDPLLHNRIMGARADALNQMNLARRTNAITGGNLLAKGKPLDKSVPYKPIVINPGHNDSYRDVFIPEFLGKWLKPHQVEGVQFMWRNVITFREGADESHQHGCVIAHAMGLGKTLQVVVFIYTLLEAISEDKEILSKNLKKKPHNFNSKQKLSGVSEDFYGRQVLILCPPGLQTNWQREFLKWLEYDGKDPSPANEMPMREHQRLEREKHLLKVRSVMRVVIRYDKLDQNAQGSRLGVLSEWHSRGGVVIMGYAGFRDIIKGQNTKGRSFASLKKNTQKIIEYLINPGPALVIADEGHSIKNQKSQISISAERMRTKARICLTGYPLQNNLDEYWTMVNFVYPKILGDYAEFHTSYSKPISNGLFADSTPVERQISAAKLKALHDHLAPLVLRQDASILEREIPPKTEYFIMCTLTSLQYNLYTALLNSIQEHVDATKKGVIARYSTFTSICNHPGAVRVLFMQRREKFKEQLNQSNNVIVTGIDSEDEEDIHDPKLIDPQRAQDEATDDSWARPVFGSVANTSAGSPNQSSKMTILLSIIYHSIVSNEKVLVFSHFRSTLSYIWWVCKNTPIIIAAEKERRRRATNLNKISRNAGRAPPIFLDNNFPSYDELVLTMDGNTSMEYRTMLIDQFNDLKNPSKVFLISTGTGSIGINLVAATRVVLFDVGWNPLYDEQAVARAYRYNQTNPVYVYRLISMGSWEQTMFQNSRHKVGLSLRVIDKVNINEKVYKDMTKQYYAPPPPLQSVKTISRNQIQAINTKFEHDNVLTSLLGKNSHRIVTIEAHSSNTNTKVSTLDSEEIVTSKYLSDPSNSQNDPKLKDMVAQEKGKLRMFSIPEKDRNAAGYGEDLDIDIDAIELNQDYILMNSINPASSSPLFQPQPQTQIQPRVQNKAQARINQADPNSSIHPGFRRSSFSLKSAMNSDNQAANSATSSKFSASSANESLTHDSINSEKNKTVNNSEVLRTQADSNIATKRNSFELIGQNHEKFLPVTVGFRKLDPTTLSDKEDLNKDPEFKTTYNKPSGFHNKIQQSKHSLLESAKAKITTTEKLIGQGPETLKGSEAFSNDEATTSTSYNTRNQTYLQPNSLLPAELNNIHTYKSSGATSSVYADSSSSNKPLELLSNKSGLNPLEINSDIGDIYSTTSGNVDSPINHQRSVSKGYLGLPSNTIHPKFPPKGLKNLSKPSQGLGTDAKWSHDGYEDMVFGNQKVIKQEKKQQTGLTDARNISPESKDHQSEINSFLNAPEGPVIRKLTSSLIPKRPESEINKLSVSSHADNRFADKSSLPPLGEKDVKNNSSTSLYSPPILQRQHPGKLADKPPHSGPAWRSARKSTERSIPTIISSSEARSDISTRLDPLVKQSPLHKESRGGMFATNSSILRENPKPYGYDNNNNSSRQPVVEKGVGYYIDEKGSDSKPSGTRLGNSGSINRKRDNFIHYGQAKTSKSNMFREEDDGRNFYNYYPQTPPSSYGRNQGSSFSDKPVAYYRNESESYKRSQQISSSSSVLQSRNDNKKKNNDEQLYNNRSSNFESSRPRNPNTQDQREFSSSKAIHRYDRHDDKSTNR